MHHTSSRAFLSVLTGLVVATAVSCAPLHAAPRSPAALGTAFAKACKNKDFKALQSLVYWKGVDAKMRAGLEKQLRDELKQPIKKVTIAPLKSDDIFAYEIGGVHYATNLKPVKRLEVQYTQATGVTETSYPVGIKEGVAFITTAVKTPKP